MRNVTQLCEQIAYVEIPGNGQTDRQTDRERYAYINMFSHTYVGNNLLASTVG